MAQVVATIKVMPESPEVDLAALSQIITEKIKSFAETEEVKIEEEPIAFGLKAVKFLFAMDEDKGSPDALEEEIRAVEHVQSAETTDVRRAVG